ncbi:hypothetical protein [Polyangium sp. y55x31]|uniref:hypothetical protein n=1 Tax=Polyangium sp. y55x31 TaxID=3042688 RepID=UPI002482FB9E|nr:hypothetical protein [Polyangium sp. y55x31]MDI1484764.1 hypothetical protein [Polyangium sp. y55x31]
MSPWDGPIPQPTDGAECGLLGLAGTILVNPIAGKGAEYLCRIGNRPRQQERDPTAPDLIVALGAGVTANYQTYTARDSFYHVFHSEFVVPLDAIPLDGLLLTVLDRDGSQPEVIGTVRLDRGQLVTAARSNPLLSLGDPRGGLQRLELVVSALTTPPETTTAPMNVRSGTVPANFRPIRAGEIVDISATGRYRIGSWNGAWIDPRGYPNGVARGYNFDNEPFRSAPHGSGLAMVGSADAKTGHSVAPCTRFVSRASGPLVLGINDTEPGNNEGSAQFAVHVRAPTAAEWLAGRTAPCLAR